MQDARVGEGVCAAEREVQRGGQARRVGAYPRKYWGWAALALGLTTVACAPLAAPEPTPSEPREVVLHGAPATQGVAQVLRVEVPQAGDERPLLLFSGSLSEYYDRRIRERDLPASLVERQIPALTWREDASAWLGNTQALASGQRYSLAELGHGLLQEFDVSVAPPALNPRIWPPAGAISPVAIYCGFALDQPRSGRLQPSNSVFEALPGVTATDDPEASALLSEECATLRVQPGDVTDVQLSPLELDGVWLDVAELAPVADAASIETTRLNCQLDEARFGPGCALVDDSFVRITKPGEPQLWILQDAQGVQRSSGTGPMVVRGLGPDTEYTFKLTVVSVAGEIARFEPTLRTAAPGARLVITEVMANPNGPEPGQEWIELVNIGSLAADLEGLVLQDAGGESVLPAWTLEPGAYALLVTAAFDPSYPFDVSPGSSVPLVVLDALGRSGLSNSGEPLLLRDASGRVLTGVPPLKQDKAGYSLARRAPELADVATSFAYHAAPGASPGAPNQLDP